MKKRNLLTITALALAGVGLSAFSAQALTYNADDLLLGFYATGGTGNDKSIVVNLGQASTYRDFTGSYFDLNLGDLGQDLVDTFGENWSTRSDLKWGVFGTTYNVAVGADPVHTLYATKPQATLGIGAAAYNRGSANTQSQAAAKIYSVGQLYGSGETAAATSPFATIQLSSLNNDFAQWQTLNGAQSFGYFNGALGNFANGAEGTALDLFRMETGSSSLKGTYEGTFLISNSGVVTFSSTVTPVPEPSTYGIAIGVAALLAVALHRRRASSRA